MKLKYVGPHDGVDVPAAGISVAHGETAEFPEVIAVSLLEQGTWERIGGKAKAEGSED